MEEYIEQDFSLCLHGKKAPCALGCPFGLDVRELLQKLQRGSFGPAYNMLRTATVFPGLVCRLCPAPCERSCAGSLGRARLSIRKLEQSAVTFNRRRDPPRMGLPPQKQRVAVVGSGLGAAACALRLAERSYPVTVFCPEERLCASLADVLPREVIEEELALQFMYAPCEMVFSSDGGDVSALGEAYDAVYLADRREETPADGRLFFHPHGEDPLEQLQDGILAFGDILWFLQTGGRRQEETPEAIPEVRFAFRDVPPPVTPENGESFSRAEARAEAMRCQKCECSRCLDVCVLLRQCGMTPINLSRGVGTSVNLFEETQGHEAMREIASCSNCGLCGTVCPVGLDIGKMLLSARAALRKRGSLPPAHHEYWLRDFAFANSPEASLRILPQGGRCRYLFFPGCQAGGSDGRYVTMTYARLRELWPDTGLDLRCCGASALWAGDRESFRETLRAFQKRWEAMGKPTVITVCPSCTRIFREYLEEIPVTTVYQLPEFIERAPVARMTREMAVFDPCAGRDDPAMRQAVRSLAVQCRVIPGELDYAGDHAQCCSWGGHGYVSNPLYAETQARERAQADPRPYLCYCTNCRDIFAARGKEAVHALDLLLGINGGAPREAPTLSQRRVNRRRLRNQMIATYDLPDVPAKEGLDMPLYPTPEAARKMNDRMILEEELSRVIRECEEEDRYLLDADTGYRICHRKLGYVTYWVEYAWEEGKCVVRNAYSHRMVIRHENEETTEGGGT